jgi:hypothetical protein
LTGYCIDDSGLIAFHQYLQRRPGDVLGAAQHGLDVMLSDIVRDMEYQATFEFWLAHVIANGWEFTADGYLV